MGFQVAFLIDGLVLFFNILRWLIIGRVLISWIAPGSRSPLVVFIVQTSEAVIAPVRRMLPRGNSPMGMIDWSPLVALILLDVIRHVVLRLVIYL